MPFTYGDKIKFIANKKEGNDVRKYVLKRSASSSSDGYKLYGYNPVENKLELLDDFGMSGNSSKPVIEERAINKIEFFCPDDKWIIERYEGDQITSTP